MNRKLPLIKLFVLTGNLVIPVYAFLLYFFYSRNVIGFLFFLFVSFCIIERAWETFKTSKERKREELHGDWPLVAVTVSYLVLFFLFIAEFYLHVRNFNMPISITGLTMWGISLRLRFWGMAALGSQWAIHAVGAQKIKRVRLLHIGPYRHIRHPIYLAIMIEELSFPIIAAAFFSFLFALFICIPLVIVRAILEEKTSLRRFGVKYQDYKKKVGMFLPLQLLRRHS